MSNWTLQVSVRLCRYASQQSVSVSKMQWRLAAWLGVWGDLILAGGAQIIHSNPDQHAHVFEPVNLSSIEEGEESVPIQLQNLNESPEEPDTSLLRETDYGPVMGFHWRDEENILAFIDIPYGAFEKPFEVNMTNVHTALYQHSKNKGLRRPWFILHKPF